MKVVWRPEAATLRPLLSSYQGQDLSYSDVGATRHERLPAGYHHLSRTMRLGTDPLALDRATEALMTWEMHRRAGLVVAASAERVAEGDISVMAFGPRTVGIVIPCRVVWTLAEPDRRGFAYGTLPGHPERGEEAFVVERVNGSVTLSITAFSEPGSRLVRAAGGVGRLIQSRMTDRYASSLADLVHA